MDFIDYYKFLDTLRGPRNKFLSAKTVPEMNLIGTSSVFGEKSVAGVDMSALMEAVRKLGEDRRGYWNMLATFLPYTSKYEPPSGRTTNVLDLACGQAHEALVLNAFFGGKEFGSFPADVTITGIDIDKRSIEVAQALYKCDNKDGQPPLYKFSVGDASSSDIVNEYPDEIDVVVLRHPQIMTQPSMWEAMLQNAYKKLKKNGLVIITTYLDAEQKIALEQARRLGGQVIVNELNPYSRPFPEGIVDARYDKHIIIVEKSRSEIDLVRFDLFRIFTFDK